jgi:hypothetical protein
MQISFYVESVTRHITMLFSVAFLTECESALSING